MKYYRLYLLSRSDNHFVGCEEIEALDDVEAVRVAELRRGMHALELWCGNRRLKNFPAMPPAAVHKRPTPSRGVQPLRRLPSFIRAS